MSASARADALVTDDPMRSLWATEGAFRLLTLCYSLFIHTDAVHHYTRPHLASSFIALQCIWSGVAAYALYARTRWRPALVTGDVAVTLGLMYATWYVAPQSWWDHNQSLPTTMWVTNAVLAIGMQWGVWAGFVGAVGLGLASLHIGGDLGWLVHSPTLPIFVSAGIAAGVGSRNIARAHAQLTAALEVRARAAERERLAREVHDGVLQVLALVARTGREIGGAAEELGVLAADQERRLRHLIADSDDVSRAPSTPGARSAVSPRRALGRTGDEAQGTAPPTDDVDLRRELLTLASTRCRVSAGSAPVEIDGARAHEVLAAVEQAVVNAERHAGPDATTFVLLEDLGSEVVITVRDDGVGIPAGRLDDARAQGRLGVSSSIRGRMADLGGRAELVTAPGEGTEWELSVPR